MKRIKDILYGTGSLGAVVLIVMIFSIAAGCGRSKPSHFYTLREVVPDAVVADNSVSGEIVLGVGPIYVPGYMERNKIVTRIDTTEVKVSEYYRWAEPAVDRIEYIIEENLTKLCPAVEVRKYTFRTSTVLTHHVQVDIMELIADINDNVVLNARYTIFPIDNKLEPVRKTVALTKPVKVGDYNELVYAMSSLLGELCVDIAESVKLLK